MNRVPRRGPRSLPSHPPNGRPRRSPRSGDSPERASSRLRPAAFPPRRAPRTISTHSGIFESSTGAASRSHGIFRTPIARSIVETIHASAMPPIRTIHKMCNAQFPPRKIFGQAILPFRMKRSCFHHRRRSCGENSRPPPSRTRLAHRRRRHAFRCHCPRRGPHDRRWHPDGFQRQLGNSVSRKTRRFGAGVSALDLKAVFAADVIFLTTADDFRPSIARALARNAGSKCRGKVILHTAATLDRTALAPFARCGAHVGSLHPMQAFGGAVMPNLENVIFAVEGDPQACRVATSIAKSLGGIPVPIHTRDKPIYHASAVIGAGSAYATVEAGPANAYAYRLHPPARPANAVSVNAPNPR